MIYTLDLPWGVKHPQVQYWKDHKIHVYKGALLPPELRPYRSEDFSYQRWKEDELNGQVMPPERGATKFVPRDHQMEAAKKIFSSYKSGWRGFLLADHMGLGKTLSGLAALSAIAKQEGFGTKNKGKLLIVCPKGVIPQWRNTLHNYPVATALMRPMIINYQQLNKLLAAPSTARVAKKSSTKNRQTLRKGTPTIDWDYIIFDEAQYLKNYPSSTMSVAASNIAQLEKPYIKGKSPYVIYSTATPGASPLNFAIMAGIIAPLISNSAEAKRITPSSWGTFLEKQGFAVKKGKAGYTWATIPYFGKNSDNPAEIRKLEMATKRAKALQRKDSQRIGKGLIKPQAPFIMRKPKDIAGWPEQQYIPYPIELTVKQQPIYEEVWTRFRNFLRLPNAHKDPKTALVENLRYRQKSSLLKVDSMIDTVQEFVENGNQVFISCEFMETLDRYKELLEKKGIKVVEMSGRNVADREQERLKFQKGEADVVLCTIVAGISLHASETLPDGTQATSTPRITILHELRLNNLDSEQILGRAHRDGQNSIAYFPYLQKTVDEKVIESFTNKNTNMKTMMGNNEKEASFMEKIFTEAAARTTPPNRLS